MSCDAHSLINFPVRTANDVKCQFSFLSSQVSQMARYEWLLLLVLVPLSLCPPTAPQRVPRPPELSAAPLASGRDEPSAPSAPLPLSLGVSAHSSSPSSAAASASASAATADSDVAHAWPNERSERAGGARRSRAAVRSERNALAPPSHPPQQPPQPLHPRANHSYSVITSPPSAERVVTTAPYEPIENVSDIYRTPFEQLHLTKRSPYALQLHVGTIYPMTGDWNGGVGCKPSIEMAVDDINARRDVLEGYELVLHTRDDRVRVAQHCCFPPPPPLTN